MRVRALVSFASPVNGEMQTWPIGREGELPPGVDWLRVGFVAAVESAPAPAVDEAPEELAPEEDADAPAPAKAKRGKRGGDGR